MAVFGFHLALNFGTSVLPAGVSALIVGIWPVITYYIAFFLIGEQVAAKKLIGGLVAFIGAALVIIFGAEHEAGFMDITVAQWVKYSLILLISPVSAAVVTVISRWYLIKSEGADLPDSLLFTLICRGIGGFYALGAFLIVREPVPLIQTLNGVPPIFWLLVTILSLYNTLFGFWLWNWVLQRLQAGSVASFTYIQTLAAVLIAWMFLDESLNTIKIIGALAIVTGVLVSNYDGMRGKIPPDQTLA